jgi:hypothetical protein
MLPPLIPTELPVIAMSAARAAPLVAELRSVLPSVTPPLLAAISMAACPGAGSMEDAVLALTCVSFIPTLAPWIVT